MRRTLRVWRASVLFGALGIATWLPGAAVVWFDERSDSSAVASEARSSSKVLERKVPSVPSRSTALDEYQTTPQQFDLRGNEIVRPVARYGVDHRGALYEMHSPLTEVPKLGPPEL
jgi:hypothetical protein